jgi:hypothetical protein
MPSHPTVLTPPSRLPKVKFLTERQLATLVKVTPETLRAWRRRGEMPPIAEGPEVQEFIAGIKGRGRKPVCYPISSISAWLFGTGSPGGRPKPLPASAFDPAADRTSHLRMAAEGTPDPKEKQRILRQLSGQAKLVARLGFASVSDYEDWVSRGSPEDELPPECRAEPDAPIVDDDSSERLQLQSDAAIAKIRHVSQSVITAERRRVEPTSPPQPEPTPRPHFSLDRRAARPSS